MSYESASEYWRARSIEMHRRAQRAEGELARFKDALLSANKHATAERNQQRDPYRMLGWMIAHISPLMHFTFRKPYVPVIEPVDKSNSGEN